MRYYLIIIVCIAYNTVLCQIDIKNESLLYPDEKIAYLGYDNSLALTGFASDSTTIIITKSDTIIKSKDYNKFFYRPIVQKDKDTLYLYSNNKLVQQFVYSLELLSKPKIYFGAIRDTLVTKEYLLTNPGLIVTFEPQIAKSDYSVRSFEVSIIKSNGKETEITEDFDNYEWEDWSDTKIKREVKKRGIPMYGASIFSNAQLKHLKRKNKGDIIWFKSATYLSPTSSSIRRMINLKLIIIE